MSSALIRVPFPAPVASCMAYQRRGDASTSRARPHHRLGAPSSTATRRVDMNHAGSRNRGPDRRVRIARWVPRGDVHGDDTVGVRTADSPANDPTTSDSAFNAADATAQWEEAQNKVDRFFLEPEASPEATRAEAKRLVEELLLAKEAEIRLKKEKETIATRAAARPSLENAFVLVSLSITLNRSISTSIRRRASNSGFLSFTSLEAAHCFTWSRKR